MRFTHLFARPAEFDLRSSTEIGEHSNLAALVFSLGCATKSLRLRDSPNRKRLGLPTLAPSFRSRRKVFGPCGSIKHREHVNLAVRAPLRPRHRVLVSIARPNGRVPGSCDPCALLRPLRKTFGLRDPVDSRLRRPCGLALSRLRRKFLRLSAQCGHIVEVL